jgi:hypothetical protein
LGDIVNLYNHGAFSGGTEGVYDTGSHFEDISNSGAIEGGAGFYAVYSDASATETLTNYSTGTVSGGVDLEGQATVTNEGSIIGGALLEGTATFANSGTIDQVDFTGAAAGSSFSNSGLLTGGLTANGASFAADNSGTIDGAVSLTGDSASLTDSGTIKQGAALAGSASSTTGVAITSTGVVTALHGYTTLRIAAGAYDVSNAGEIMASAGQYAVEVNAGGELVSDGKIAGYTTFPKEHRAKIHSTNPLERLNGEIKRRTDVVGIFPNEAAIVRLVGAILLEQNDEWAIQRRYMSLETLGSVSDNATVSLPAVAA